MPEPASRRAMNLAQFLTQAARRFPDRPALVQGERTLTWAAFDARASALAAGLAARGVARGDRVLVHARNGPVMLESMFAAFRLGAVWVPTNVRLTAPEVAGLAQTSGARAFLCEGDAPAHAAAVAAPLVLRIGEGRFGEAEVGALVDAHLGTRVRDADVERDDACWFFFTSGTTGRPKAAVLTHGQMGFVVTNHLCDLMPGLTEADVSLAVAPLSHGAGIHCLTQVARGAATVLTESARLDPAEAWSLIERHRVTNLFTVPTILTRLVEHPARRAHDASSLRFVIYAGAPMYRADQRRAIEALGPVLVQYFGLGEVTGAVTVLPPRLHSLDDAVRPGTCGHPRTGMQVQIQDEAGHEREPGETGEICVCGPAVFAGYHENPEANAAAFRDGWFRTGDLGHVDEAGFLTVTGRASDMYISGGANVYPREVEEAILRHEAVAEAAVVGVPDPAWGEVGVAVLVLRAGEVLDEAALLAWLDGRLARYKAPRRVVVWDALPQSGYGKVPKALLREELSARGVVPAG